MKVPHPQKSTIPYHRIYNLYKIRTNIDDGQLQAAKDEITSINGELKKLRREVKLCEDIAERSKVMEENLEHIKTEEQKQQRKEKSRYEQRW